MVEGAILNHCGPLFFSRSHELTPAGVTCNATFGLVDTGQVKLLVTCHHVVEKFRELRAKGDAKAMGVLLGSGRPVELNEAQLRDEDKRLDLAVFDMSALLPDCAKRAFCSLHWPLAARLRPKDVLAFVGYSGVGRSISSGGANFQYEAFGLSVSDVDGVFIAADMSRLKQAGDAAALNLPTDQSIGGVSGSPCFKLSVDLRLTLVGFLTEEALQIVRMTNASCILPNGRLDRKL
jgi:hypothetical protein